MKRKLLTIFVALIVLFAGVIYFITSTEPGLLLIISVVKNLAPELSVSKIRGRLIGPLELRGIRYSPEEFTINVDVFQLDWKPSHLMFFKVHINDMRSSGISYESRKSDRDIAQTGGVPDIRIPVEIIVKNLSLKDITYLSAGDVSPFIIEEVMFKGNVEKEEIHIEKFRTIIPEFTIEADGDIKPYGDYPLNLKAYWKARLPGYSEIRGKGGLNGSLKLLEVKQEIDAPFNAQISISVSDPLEELHWKGDFSVNDFALDDINSTWPEIYLSLKARCSGTQRGLKVETLFARLMEGELSGNGEIEWEPFLRWNASVKALSLNPGAYWEDWPANLDVNVRGRGEIKDGKPRLYVDGLDVHGKLRGYPFRAFAVIEAEDNAYVLSKFQMRSGESRLTASGSYADKWDMNLDIIIPELKEVLPGVSGEVYGNGRIAGKRQQPQIFSNLNARNLTYGTNSAKKIEIDISVDTSDSEDSIVNVVSEHIFYNSFKINHFSLDIMGKKISHTAKVIARSDKESVVISFDAGYEDKIWRGRLISSELDISELGIWRQRQSEAFLISPVKARMDKICWLRDYSSLCLRADWNKNEGLSGNVEISRLPATLFNMYIPDGLELDGTIEGHSDIVYSKEILTGNIELGIQEGSVYYRVDEEETLKMSLGKAHLTGKLNKDKLVMRLYALLPDRGYIKGDADLPGFASLTGENKKQSVSGLIEAELNVLDLVPAFTSKIQDTKGALSANMKLSGSLDKPIVAGRVELREGYAIVPDIGVSLKNVNLVALTTEDGIINMKGRLESGKGWVVIGGNVNLNNVDKIKASIHLEGENFELAKIPELWLTVSPDIQMEIDDRHIHVEGDLFIPEASLSPPDLSEAVPVSKDVVIITEKSREKAPEEWKISSGIRLTLGNKVSFDGFGLTCRIKGSVNLTDEPGKATSARGELNIMDGQYRAYGRELKIETGRLVFQGIIDDPYLDIRAVRQIKDVTAGVQVSSTLKSPQMNLFSIPSMNQSDALSYLLFGRPMNRLSGSEGSQLYNAAASAGLSGGGFLAKKIGAAFGLEDVEIEKGETLEEAVLVIGNYLSPKLYVSYGIGLFQTINILRLRYQLSPRWMIQTEYGIESGGDILYKLER